MGGYKYFVGYGDNFGNDLLTLHPRVPLTRGEDEPLVKRVCLAPSIAHCLVALPYPSLDSDFNYYAYFTDCATVPAKNVRDSEITKEMWSLDSVEIKICYQFKKDFIKSFFSLRRPPFRSIRYSKAIDLDNLRLARKLLKYYGHSNIPH